jgi:hypothetical protein
MYTGGIKPEFSVCFALQERRAKGKFPTCDPVVEKKMQRRRVVLQSF